MITLVLEPRTEEPNISVCFGRKMVRGRTFASRSREESKRMLMAVRSVLRSSVGPALVSAAGGNSGDSNPCGSSPLLLLFLLAARSVHNSEMMISSARSAHSVRTGLERWPGDPLFNRTQVMPDSRRLLDDNSTHFLHNYASSPAGPQRNSLHPSWD